MRLCVPVLSASMVLGFAADEARAAGVGRFVEAHAGLRVGGLTGRGQGDAATRQRDFFELVRGPVVGFQVGCKLLGLDLSLRFHQVLEGRGEIGDPGDRISRAGRGEIADPGAPATKPDTGLDRGTMTQLMLGFEMEFPVGLAFVVKPRIAAGLAFGTREEIRPPLDGADVTHKGFVGEATIALQRRLGALLSIGLEAVGGYHYLLGGNLVVNDPENWVRGSHVLGLLTMTAHVGL